MVVDWGFASLPHTVNMVCDSVVNTQQPSYRVGLTMLAHGYGFGLLLVAVARNAMMMMAKLSRNVEQVR